MQLLLFSGVWLDNEFLYAIYKKEIKWTEYNTRLIGIPILFWTNLVENIFVFQLLEASILQQLPVNGRYTVVWLVLII